jgi:uncharacterized protein (TIGR02145 family)
VIDWYAESSGGSVLSGGLGSNNYSVIVNSSNMSKTFYAEARDIFTGCVSSARTAVTATMNALPQATGIDATRCGAGVVTLSATTTSDNTVIDWYLYETIGSPYSNGIATNSFSLSLNINQTLTRYAQARDTITGCLSASRTAVTATAYNCITDGEGVTDCDGNFYHSKIYDGVEWMIDNSKKTCNLATCPYYIDDGYETFGNLYFYACAASACPDGWRLPDNDDFTALNTILRSHNSVGALEDWNAGYALAGYGYLLSNGISYGWRDRSFSGNWWSSSSSGDSDSNFGESLDTGGSNFQLQVWNVTRLLSVRCIKNP